VLNSHASYAFISSNNPTPEVAKATAISKTGYFVSLIYLQYVYTMKYVIITRKVSTLSTKAKYNLKYLL